ncbi:MAG: zinc-binding dehydrogenase [Rhodobacter sp.]|nr:zinc-binding dehydrogenase [Rhodobacter sp.]
MPMEIVIPSRRTFALECYQDAPLCPGEIRGRTLYTLVSQGTEIGWANGNSFPIRPGYAAVFRVDEIGDGVTGVAKGELRFAMGHHRATQTHDARHTLPLPEGLEPGTAVLARLMGVSVTTLMTTRARPGDRVIVTGAGPVGLLAAHLFRMSAYRVTVVDPDATRRSQAKDSGITDVHAAMPLGDPAYQGKVALVVDCSGHEGAALDGCKIVQRMGEVVLVGVPWRKLSDHSAHDVTHAVFFNHVTLRSGWEWELPMHGRIFLWEELLEGYNNSPHSIFGGFERSLRWLAEGQIPIGGLIHRASPEDPAAIYAAIMARQITEPFILLDWEAMAK